jgi:hypothetical protein
MNRTSFLKSIKAAIAGNLFLLAVSTVAAADPVHLQTDSLPSPIGIDTTTPVFSWQSDSKNHELAAVRIPGARGHRREAVAARLCRRLGLRTSRLRRNHCKSGMRGSPCVLNNDMSGPFVCGMTKDNRVPGSDRRSRWDCSPPPTGKPDGSCEKTRHRNWRLPLCDGSGCRAWTLSMCPRAPRRTSFIGFTWMTNRKQQVCTCSPPDR